VYSKIFTKSPDHLQVYTIKLMTGWLPVHHHTNKMVTTKQYCPLCQNEETIAHLLQCNGRRLWQQQFLANLQRKLKQLHTTDELYHRVVNYFTTITTDSANYHHYKHFTVFAGLLPQQWTQKVCNTDNMNAHQHIWSSNWPDQIGKWLLHQGHTLWNLRNKKIHEKDTTTPPLQTYLNQKIRQLYELQNDIGYHDRDMFQQPLEERLQLSEKQKMTWIDQTTKTMKVSMETYQRLQTTGQQDIRNFFTKAPQSS